jgi:ferritin-like metal-binding protein YciE
MDSYTGPNGGTALEQSGGLTGDSSDERPARWASRKLRRAANQMSEDQTGRDLLLMAADRVNSLEHRLPELFSRKGLEDLEREVRAHPARSIALAVGAGYLLERTKLLQTVVGGVAGTLTSAVFSGDHRNGSSEEEQLLAWLNDAYAMEKAQIPVLENHAKDARRHPEVRKRDLQHLEETKQHARDVKRCIEHLGEKPSVTKKAIGRLTGAMNSVATEPFQDEIMKNFLMDYAAESFEIACYRSLIVAAEEAGHPKVARVCEEILKEEEEMAEWIRDHLPKAVHITLSE